MRKILRGHVFYKKFLITLCLGFSFLFEAHAQVSGTFTINSAVATGGSNFQTFSAAAAFLAGGVNGPVIFNVQAGSGPYVEQVILNTIAGTSATNTITFNCNGVTLRFLSTNYNQRAGVKLKGTDYLTFDNLTVLPQAATAGQYGYGFHLLNDADHNTIKNCRITNFSDYNNSDDHEGIVINGSDAISYDFGNSFCDDNLIQNNTISGGSVGITLSSIPASGAPQFMTGNKILNNTITNANVYGIQMHCSSGTLIDSNDISGGPATVETFMGMYLDYFNQSFNITNNRIHGFHVASGRKAYGLYIASESASGKECVFSNNLIYDFQGNNELYGIFTNKLSAPTTYSTSYLNIYHNTISLDDQSVAGTNAFGISLSTVSDVNVMNNIVTVTRNSTNSNYGIYIASAPIRFASQRNVIYVQDGPASIDAVGYYVKTYNTMAAWQKATGFDYYSTDVNPLYTNAAGFNFRPTAQAIDNMAANVGITTDIVDAARNTASPDPGCYEFTSAPCSAGITAGTANVLPDSILCLGPKISLGLTGNSSGSGQTYTWQSSTSATGTFTNLTSPLGFPYYEYTPTTTLYYRVALTCGASTAYSQPVRVLVNKALNTGTYTINSALPTGGINFNSFGDAILSMQCGLNGSVVFNVASGSGPYNEQLIIPALNTSPTQTVTFNCNGVTMAYAPTVSSRSAVIKLNGADYITIDSLNVDVQGSSTFGFGIQLINNADHNTIKRCTINVSKTATSTTYAGIVINSSDFDPKSPSVPSYCDSNLITNNTVNGGYYGIIIASTSISPGISNSVGNILRKNTVNDSYLFGIFLTGVAKTLVDSNDISQPTRTVLAGFTGIYVLEVNFGLTISRNKIHHLGERAKTTIAQFEGVKCEVVKSLPDDPIVISNNLMYTWRGTGIQMGLTNIASSYTKYYHNTISLDDSSSAGSSVTRGFGSFSASPGVEVKDNSFVIRRGGTGAKHGIYISLDDSGLVANYNNYYISSAGTGPVNIGYMSKNYSALSDWLATRKDSGSISMDPVFYDIATGDLTPTKIPFENRGSNVGITSDVWNVTRSTTRPDIGAIEFTICRDLTTPVLSLDSAGVNTIRFKWTAVQNTSGYRVSRDGITWTIPSSGALGTNHTISGLKPRDTMGLMVKALGSRVDCPEYLSQRLLGQSLTDGIFIPNTFTPNGNGQNDVFKVYTNVMRSVHWMVFNQWGEKVFETTDLQGSWDGSFKGKPQPVGVYVYVVVGILPDGTKVSQKGTFNLVR